MFKSRLKNLNSESDETLLTSYRNGDQSAFEVLYGRHCDALYRFILRQCNRNVSLTEEIFQDTWSNIINNASQYRGDAKFSTYLYQVCRNKIIDHGRKSVTHREKEHEDTVDNLSINDNHQPDHQAQLEKCIELLQQLIRQLPEEQKEAFLLRQESDHTLNELAEITRTTLETVKSRLRYAMKKLREWLPGDCL